MDRFVSFDGTEIAYQQWGSGSGSGAPPVVLGAAAVELGGVDTRIRPVTEMVAALLADDASTITDPLILQFREFADALGGDREALAAQAMAVHARPIALDRIAAPTLVLAGRDDPLATRPQVLAAAIADARVELLAGDHLSAVTNPAFAPAIVGFLTAARPGG